LADLTIITSLYPAGEKEIPGITSERLAEEITNSSSIFLEWEKLLTHLPKLLAPGDVLVTIGAGDVTTVGPRLISSR
ncbi:MAG: UDP-N-acetylmuramate--L-alanine ligase, partial [Chlamydiia bacterium]|nr:UDP-N-acetylmuramate--L-alanine ligase [Chlamydiia bacterium]